MSKGNLVNMYNLITSLKALLVCYIEYPSLHVWRVTQNNVTTC